MMVAADADGGGSLIAADVMMTSSGGSKTVNIRLAWAYAYCTFLLCDGYTCKNYLKRILWQGRNKILRSEKEVRATSMTLLVRSSNDKHVLFSSQWQCNGDPVASLFGTNYVRNDVFLNCLERTSFTPRFEAK
jgi:hypothetical protein